MSRLLVRAMTSFTLGLLVAACGTSNDNPTAAPVPAISFHPCDGFGVEAQAAAGFSPGSMERREDRQEPFRRLACWFDSESPEYGTTISSNEISLERVETDERFTLRDVSSVGGHRALLHDFPGGLSCLVSIDFDSAVLEFMVGYKTGAFATADQACPQAVKVATDLAPYFPDHL